MRSLADLTLKTSYHKGRDDIATDFYLPCLHRAREYDRAVGYFRSTVFIIAWPALRDFVERGGRIRLLCSQVLSAEDIDALEQGYSARSDERLAARLQEEVKAMVRDKVLEKPARILGALVASDVIDLQIAILRNDELGSAKGRIFHDKLGLFRDSHGNTVCLRVQ